MRAEKKDSWRRHEQAEAKLKKEHKNMKLKERKDTGRTEQEAINRSVHTSQCESNNREDSRQSGTSQVKAPGRRARKCHLSSM